MPAVFMVVRKFCSRRLSCQSKRSVQGYYINFKKCHLWRNAKLSSRPILTKYAAIFTGSRLLLTTVCIYYWCKMFTFLNFIIRCKVIITSLQFNSDTVHPSCCCIAPELHLSNWDRSSWIFSSLNGRKL